MSGLEPLAALLRPLDAAEIPHMLVGSMASTHYGPPRSTQDIDLVIDPGPDDLENFLGLLDRERFYVPETTARQAFVDRSQFNVIDLRTAWKFDLMIRRDRPFSVVEFARRRRVTVDGVAVHIASPEDTVLAKLEWARASGSERQLTDAAGVLSVQGDALDHPYLEHWAAALGVAAELERARER